MASPDVTVLQRSGLNDFLFAEIGTEPNGMTLSVVSVFARQGCDPWCEAGRLANLPKADATDSLARTIAGMPQSRWSLADALLIAARLIDLLPTGRIRSASLTETSVIRWLPYAGWRPSARTGFALICFALGIGYAVSILLQHNGTVSDGSDVATFAAPSLNATP